jgi:hypothetical protein
MSESHKLTMCASKIAAMFLSVALLAATQSSFAGTVTLDFEAGIAPFVADSGGTVSWTQVDTDGDGTTDTGAMEVMANGGYAGNAAKFEVASNPAFLAELNNAIANGGSISYDVYVIADEVMATAVPGWFESYFVVQTGTNAGASLYDQNAITTGQTFPLAAGTVFTQTVTMPIVPNGTATNDGNGNTISSAADWGNIWLGSNNDGAGIASLKMYFDNVVVESVPEPSSAMLLGFLALGLGFLRVR